LTYNGSVFVFVETPLFTRLVSEYLSDDEYLELQRALARNPEAGPIIPGSGGVRKLRWALPGWGKLRSRQGLIWMPTLYPKNVAENIPAHLLNHIRQEIEYD
jgi:hypothetical protein